MYFWPVASSLKVLQFITYEIYVQKEVKIIFIQAD